MEKASPASGPRIDSRLPRFSWGAEGTPVPPLPTDSDPTLEVWRDRNGSAAAYGHSAYGNHWVRLPGVAAFAYDPDLDEVTTVAERGVSRSDVAEAYRRVVLPMIQQARRSQVLHASGVRAAAGVVAFCGTSGTGKSTIAYGLARRAYPLWGDDAVCFAGSGRGIESSPLPFDLLLRASTASFFDTTAGPVATRSEITDEATEPVPLAAVCVLRAEEGVASTETDLGVTRLASAKSFTAILEHAYSFGLRDKQRRARLIADYLDLVATTPVYDVSFEHDFEQLDRLLDEIEQRLRLEPPQA
jgi:hypothetical protein